MKRQQQLNLWLQSQFPGETFNLTPASADASFRRYFRATFLDRTLIVMDAPPEHEDCRPFLHVGRLFEQAGVHVPHVYAQDLEQGFLLLSDLGNTTYLQALSGRGDVQQQGTHRPPPCGETHINARQLYGTATDALIKIQLASKEDELPPYDEALLLREMRLFPEWYINTHLNITLTDAQNAKLETVFSRIIANNLAQPRVYVHRDYHSRNLMLVDPTRWGEALQCGRIDQAATPANGSLCEERVVAANPNPGIIDFQDAVYGPITYDLVSLFKDAYIKWDEEQIIDHLIGYWQKARSAGLPVSDDFGQFYWDYEWMGVQRHIKVLGIFARLCHRDGKDGYLKDMPLVMGYLRAAAARYVDLKPLFNLLNELEPPLEAPTGYGF
ncbi:MAG: phosphotransferase [Proteobacteria bacterium]|nr:phosphotransferase [Pseudomonadota bacterium]